MIFFDFERELLWKSLRLKVHKYFITICKCCRLENTRFSFHKLFCSISFTFLLWCNCFFIEQSLWVFLVELCYLLLNVNCFFFFNSSQELIHRNRFSYFLYSFLSSTSFDTLNSHLLLWWVFYWENWVDFDLAWWIQQRFWGSSTLHSKLSFLWTFHWGFNNALAVDSFTSFS